VFVQTPSKNYAMSEPTLYQLLSGVLSPADRESGKYFPLRGKGTTLQRNAMNPTGGADSFLEAFLDYSLDPSLKQPLQYIAPQEFRDA